MPSNQESFGIGFALVKRQAPYIIEPLDPAKHGRDEFDCGVVALNDYLKKRARKEMEAGLAACFVAVPVDEPGRIAGFCTLSAATIGIVDLPETITRRLPRYRDFPATLVGRLARSVAFKGMGIGDRLMMSALAGAATSSLEVASWAVVTDPKDEAARRFYQTFGFSDLDENRMFIPMKDVAVMLGAKAR